MIKTSIRVSSPQVHRIQTGIPCAMVYRLLRGRPGVPGL
jgi:hypothetical protein